MARTVAIGNQDFGEMIKEQCFYVDKTNFIKEWWENKDKVTLITRPRRFGKTLNMSMLDYFFSIRHKDDRDIFAGLSIWKDEAYRERQGTYPVISLSFANVKGKNFETVIEKIYWILISAYQSNRFLLDDGFLNGNDVTFFNRVSPDMSRATAELSLNQLSNYLYQYYGRKVIILLDEYDTPMQEAYVNGYWDEMIDFTRGLFHAAFKTNPYLERALMTGITRISKESIFSDLNNLKVITTLSDQYATSFGFTEREVFTALEEYGLEDQKEEVKFWYNGFQFGKSNCIYNPWSIINFLDDHKFGLYWSNTSTNSLVGQLIQDGSDDVKTIMENLIQGGTYKTQIDEEIVYRDLSSDVNAIWSLLLSSGYLKVVNIEMNRRKRKEYTLEIVNYEVLQMFQSLITRWFCDSNEKLNGFCDALLSGNLELMNEYMNLLTSGNLSYHDILNENSYHMFVLGVIANLNGECYISSNPEMGMGRCDTLIGPKDKSKGCIILEYKKFDEKTDRDLNHTVRRALTQILKKKYYATLESNGVPEEKIRIYGFAFRGKEVLIDGGYIRNWKERLDFHA